MYQPGQQPGYAPSQYPHYAPATYNQRLCCCAAAASSCDARAAAPSAVDLVQVTDGTTGEMAFFRFPCEGSSRCGDQFVAKILKSIL